jgi:hypothetical protein
MEGLEERFQEAVQSFWTGRETQLQKQIASGKVDAGTRGAVTGGGHMAALEALVVALLIEVGLDQADIKVKIMGATPLTPLELPGYYRPQKQWDVLVVANNQLIAAIEFKSQVGSIGNNLNNRAEEAIGLAKDFWTTFREGRLGPRRPFLGFFLLVEDSAKVRSPVPNCEPYFPIDPIFQGASYIQRYRIFCQRLVLERLYDSVCLTFATNDAPTQISHPTPDLSFQQFASQLQGHARAFANS